MTLCFGKSSQLQNREKVAWREIGLSFSPRDATFLLRWRWSDAAAAAAVALTSFHFRSIEAVRSKLLFVSLTRFLN